MNSNGTSPHGRSRHPPLYHHSAHCTSQHSPSMPQRAYTRSPVSFVYDQARALRSILPPFDIPFSFTIHITQCAWRCIPGTPTDNSSKIRTPRSLRHSRSTHSIQQTVSIYTSKLDHDRMLTITTASPSSSTRAAATPTMPTMRCTTSALAAMTF